MLRKSALVRYFSYSVGTLFTVANLLIITTNLEIYQFAVWGVANSLIYIFSQISQLTYVQYVEKYFPTYSKEKMERLLYKFLKTIFSTLPVWLLVLFLLNQVGYFLKYNANNLFILFGLISTISVIESAIEVTSKHFLALKKTENFDLNELVIFKIFRFIAFYFLLINGYSVYYLLLANLIIRSLFLLKVLNINKDGVFNITKNILMSNMLKDNFNNLRYTFTAFLIKTFQVTFLNVIFLILTINADNITIANYSLAILIINNCRPIVSSFSGLLTPIISENVDKKRDSSSLINFSILFNSVVIAILTFIVYIITEYQIIIGFFLNQFDDLIYPIIFISFFSSCIASLYSPRFMNILFSNNEKKLLAYVSTNYFICSLAYYLLNINETFNLVYIYIIYESVTFLLTRLFKFENTNKFIINQFGLSFLFMIFLVFINELTFNISIQIFLLLFIFVLTFDLRRVFKLFEQVKK